MIHVLVTVTLAPGTRDRFLEVFNANVPAVRAEDGCLEYGAAELLRLRDAYLEAWTGDHDRDDLVEAARLAVRVGGVSRADCYRRALLESHGPRPPFEEAAWLKEQRGPTPLEPDS